MSHDSAAPPFAFVLMPFSEAFQEVYAKGIKAGCDDVSVRCERADDQIFNETIVSRIYDQIFQADVVIADLTEPNPNVYYEVGYARAIRKRMLLLTGKASSIPFDLRGYRHIEYGQDVAALRTAVETNVSVLVSRREPGELTAAGFPWPALVRRSMAVLDAAERRFVELDQDLDAFGAEFKSFAELLGVRGAPDIQVSLVRRDRTLLYHDYTRMIGRPACHVGLDRHNIYDEIFCRDSGSVAWVDGKSNSPRIPRVRTNFAFFRTLGQSGAKVVVEIHDELR